MSDLHTGGCLCGAVRFAVRGPLRPAVACHCIQCRKTTGNHVAATSAGREMVDIQGEVRWYRSSATARRGFCGTCGSALFWDGPGVNLSIMAGALDTPTGLTLREHIHCASKPDWYQIADGLPQAAGPDPDMTTQVRE